MLSIITLLLLFALPLLVFPLGTSPFEPPKVIAAEVLMELMLFLTILKNQFKWPLRFNALNLAFSLLLSLTLLDLLFLRSTTTFFGNSFRLQGVFLLWHLLIFALISARVNLSQKLYYFSLATLTVLTASVFILGGEINGRAFGTLGEPNSLAGAALFLLPFGLLKTPRWVKIITLSEVFLLIFLSGSRTGILAFLIQLIFVGLVFIFKLKLGRAFVIAALLSLSLWVLPIWAGGGWYGNRSEIWYTSLVAGSLSPLFGHGFGNTQDVLHKASLLLGNNIQYQVVDSSHNIFLDFWIQGGLAAVVALVILISLALRDFLKKGKLKELMIILGLLTTLSFNPVSVFLLVTFWWILGQGFQKEV